MTVTGPCRLHGCPIAELAALFSPKQRTAPSTRIERRRGLSPRRWRWRSRRREPRRAWSCHWSSRRRARHTRSTPSSGRCRRPGWRRCSYRRQRSTAEMPLTATGARAVLVVPLPSSPAQFSPQQRTVPGPEGRMWKSPAAIATAARDAAHRDGGGAVCGRPVAQLGHESLSPQQRTVPPVRRAQAWSSRSDRDGGREAAHLDGGGAAVRRPVAELAMVVAPPAADRAADQKGAGVEGWAGDPVAW